MGFFDSLTSTLTSIFDSPWDLHEAAKEGNIERLEVLINKYKPIHGLDYLNHQRWTALSYALLNNRYNCVLALLSSGAHPDARSNGTYNRDSALEDALRYKDYAIFRVLLFFWNIPTDINNCDLVKSAVIKRSKGLDLNKVKKILTETSALKALKDEVKSNQEQSLDEKLKKLILIAEKFEALTQSDENKNKDAIVGYYSENAIDYYQQSLSCLTQLIQDIGSPKSESDSYYYELMNTIRSKLDALKNPNKEAAAGDSIDASKDKEATEQTPLLHQRRPHQ